MFFIFGYFLLAERDLKATDLGKHADQGWTGISPSPRKIPLKNKGDSGEGRSGVPRIQPTGRAW